MMKSSTSKSGHIQGRLGSYGNPAYLLEKDYFWAVLEKKRDVPKYHFVAVKSAGALFPQWETRICLLTS